MVTVIKLDGNTRLAAEKDARQMVRRGMAAITAPGVVALLPKNDNPEAADRTGAQLFFHFCLLASEPKYGKYAVDPASRHGTGYVYSCPPSGKAAGIRYCAGNVCDEPVSCCPAAAAARCAAW